MLRRGAIDMGAAQSEQLGPVATRTLFENDDVRVWEMDLQPGEVCGLHHHTLDYVLFILSSASVGALRRGENPPGGKPRGFMKRCSSSSGPPSAAPNAWASSDAKRLQGAIRNPERSRFSTTTACA